MRQFTSHSRRAGSGREGVSILAVTILVVASAALSAVLLASVRSSASEQRGSRENLSSMYGCEAGLAEAVFDLSVGGTGDIGSNQDPTDLGGGLEFWVQSTDLGGGLTSLVATGQSERARSRMELVVRQATADGFNWAAFGDESLTMDSNALVDSYDSSLGDYASQEVNGNGGGTYANSNGDVGSNGDVEMDQNAAVYGDAQPGVSSTITILGNATVSGSTAPMAEPQALPPLQIPPLPLIGDYIVSGSQTLLSGQYHFGEFQIETGETLTVVGPATLVLDSMELCSNSELLVDSSAGPVEIYVIDDFELSSNTLVASLTWNPADISIYLESDNIIDPGLPVDLDQVDFESNAQLYGTIYAPNASININSNFELFGGIVARRMHLDSNSRIHYDEALSRGEVDARGAYETVLWRVLSSAGA